MASSYPFSKIYAMIERDFAARVNFSHCLQNKKNKQNPRFESHVSFSHEAIFVQNGNVNKYNSHFSSYVGHKKF